MTDKTFVSSERLKKLSGKMWLMIILKVKKPQCFTFFLEDKFLKKPRRRPHLNKQRFDLIKKGFMKSEKIVTLTSHISSIKKGPE